MLTFELLLARARGWKLAGRRKATLGANASESDRYFRQLGPGDAIAPPLPTPAARRNAPGADGDAPAAELCFGVCASSPRRVAVSSGASQIRTGDRLGAIAARVGTRGDQEAW